jgi:hypothetical protein
MESTHVSDRSSYQSTQFGHLSHLTPIITAEVKNYTSIQCRVSGKIVFFMLVPYREFISLVMTSILIVHSHIRGVF